MSLSGSQKVLLLLNRLKSTFKRKSYLVLLFLLTISISFMSAGIFLKGIQPYDRFREGFTVEIDGIQVTGDLSYSFDQAETHVSFSLVPLVIISDSSYTGTFTNITISSSVLNLFIPELVGPSSTIITGWSMAEPVMFSCESVFVINGDSGTFILPINHTFKAGISESTLHADLNSTGFLIAASTAIGLIIWLFRGKEPDYDRGAIPEVNVQKLVCDSCEQSFPNWIRFCTYCGKELPKKCQSPNCGQKYPAHARFCPFCGTSSENFFLPPLDTESGLAKLARSFVVFSFAGFLAITVLNALLLAPAYTLVFSQFNLLKRFTFALFLPVPLPIIVFEGIFLLLYVVIIFAIIAYIMTKALVSDFKSLARIREPINNLASKIHKLNDNGLILLFKLYTMSFALQITITLIFSISGIAISSPITVPEGEGGVSSSLDQLFPSWNNYPSDFISLIFGLINATIYEELIIRVLFIGMPIFLIEFLKKWRKNQKQADFKQIVGINIADKRRVNRTEWLLIGGSSLLFGAAHLISWDPWKLLPATIVGIFLGYMFVKKGIVYAVILHGAYDYMPFSMLLQFVDTGAILGTSNASTISLFLVIIFPIILMILMISFIISGFIFLARLWSEEIVSNINSNKVGEKDSGKTNSEK